MFIVDWLQKLIPTVAGKNFICTKRILNMQSKAHVFIFRKAFSSTSGGAQQRQGPLHQTFYRCASRGSNVCLKSGAASLNCTQEPLFITYQCNHRTWFNNGAKFSALSLTHFMSSKAEIEHKQSHCPRAGRLANSILSFSKQETSQALFTSLFTHCSVQ